MHFFSQMTNHGMAETVSHDMKAAVAAFFELPLEGKMKYAVAATVTDLQGHRQGCVVLEQQKRD